MSRPSLTPLQTYGSPMSSAYDIHTPRSEESFDQFSYVDDSDIYSETSSRRSQQSRPYIETRRPSFERPPSFLERPPNPRRTSVVPTMASVVNADFVYYAFKKETQDWAGNASYQPIPAAQSEIRKIAEGKNKSGSATDQLRSMNVHRRAHIEHLIKDMNAKENGVFVWEPVYLYNTKVKQKGPKVEVKAFEIILQRRLVKTAKTSGPGLVSSLKKPENNKSKGKEKEKEKEKPVEKVKKAKEKRTREPEKAPKAGIIVDDAFSNLDVFDQNGTPIGNYGPVNSAGPGLPPYIPKERPIGHRDSRATPGFDVEADEGEAVAAAGAQLGGQNFINLDDLFKNNPKPGAEREDEDEDDEIMKILNQGEKRSARERTDKRSRRQTRSRTRSASRHRRPALHQRSRSRSRVRFSNSHLPSSDSSELSEDVGFVFEEVDDLSSRTSEDTFRSSPRPKAYRSSQHHLRRTSMVSPTSPRRHQYSEDEKVLVPAQTRGRPSLTVKITPEQRDELGVEQTLIKRSRPQRPKVELHHESGLTTLPGATKEVPPQALYPDELDRRERERDRQREFKLDQMRQSVLDNYMHTAERERTLRLREDNIEERERMVRDMQFQNEQAQREQAAREEDRRQLAMREQAAKDDNRRWMDAHLENLRGQMDTINTAGGPGEKRRSVYNYEPRNTYGNSRYR